MAAEKYFFFTFCQRVNIDCFSNKNEGGVPLKHISIYYFPKYKVILVLKCVEHSCSH